MKHKNFQTPVVGPGFDLSLLLEVQSALVRCVMGFILPAPKGSSPAQALWLEWEFWLWKHDDILVVCEVQIESAISV